MELLKIAVLALAQGIAEFLPVSSSGHLSVMGHIAGFDPDANMTLGIILHAGTLAAIIVFYMRELLRFFKPERYHLALMVIAGSVPAGIAGIVLKKSGAAEALFNSQLTAGIGFIITGLMLQFAQRRKAVQNEEAAVPIEKISLKQALCIGLAQAVAILPGISRSGSTISAGLMCNLKNQACAEFSFLLAIPAIGGAALLEILDLMKTACSSGAELSGGGLLLGFAVSAAVGYGSLVLLIRLLKRGKLAFFSWYLYIIGSAVIIWQLTEIF